MRHRDTARTHWNEVTTMPDILNPTIEDAKLHVTMIIDGHSDIVAREIDRMPSPVLREYTKLVINLLATVKANELQNRGV
jgi:hypothetical protein